MVKSKQLPREDPRLATWTDLNVAIMDTYRESELEELIELERSGRNRRAFLRRIQSRINRLRSARELLEVAR